MKGKKIIKIFVEVIFVEFVFSYVIEESGYYEYNLQSKKSLTEEEIKKFEDDVKKGKNVDVEDYLNDVSVDYSNKLTNGVSRFNLNLNRYLVKTITNTINIFSKLVK